MKWEWHAIDIFRYLIGAVGTWLALYLKKNAIPFFKSVRRVIDLADRVDKLENEVCIAKSKTMAVLHTAIFPVFIVNLTGELIYANPAWMDMTGFTSVNDAYGKGYMQAIPVEDVDGVEKQSERLVEHPSSFEGIVRFRHVKTGVIITTKCRSEPVRDKDKKVVEMIGRLEILKIIA